MEKKEQLQLLSAFPIKMITDNAAFGSRCVLHNSAREVKDPVETYNSYVAGIFHSFTLLCVVKYNFPKHAVLWFLSILKISFWSNWSWNTVVFISSANFFQTIRILNFSHQQKRCFELRKHSSPEGNSVPNDFHK